jgi:hypothetical protein
MKRLRVGDVFSGSAILEMIAAFPKSASMTTQSSPAVSPMGRSRINDAELQVRSGYLMLTASLVLLIVSTWWVWIGFTHTFALARIGLGVLGIIASLILVSGLVILQPNESVVCLLFGRYVGTQHRPGYWWVNPFSTKKRVSRRLETLECGPLKVNDAVGNPVDIGAVIVWRIEDAAKAVLEVVSYQTLRPRAKRPCDARRARIPTITSRPRTPTA